ncbi:ABC transporter ATP-binding protein [Inquilinus limosus]|uniref:Sugar ABC transporter ATP-binding protein n=1 Tax=Inquilinus limosus TaxID=171674 RepID=A0A211ZBY0_9PROT|nr:sn-glycerol-3-phosphate ABC transporter ATP-binding protein UgpC [Inquilinus limosus]OWJ62745.1 sugar ABC transporter ATP-binding protein [Inquilinus limosus]
MASLTIQNVIKRYGAIEILKGINIGIDDGEFLVLVGPSGCGKSTLLNMIAGLDTISDGSIAIDGQRVNDLHPKDRDIAMVFQSYALYPNMSVEQNIGFGLEMRGVPKEQRAKAIAEVARLLQMEHLLKRKPSQLSGGQRQRVAMGRALVRDPKIFLFDEPLSNLDAKLRVEMRTEIKKLHQRLKSTIVYVTHDQIEAMTLATRIAVMRAGELQQLGTPREIYDTPANTFVAGFMGSPPMNLIKAKVVDHNGGPHAAIDRMHDGEVVLPLPANDGLRGAAGREIILGLRPENITDPQGAVSSGGPTLAADCLIEVTEPTGPDLIAVVEMGGKEVLARLRPDAEARPGQRSRLVFDMGKAVVFDAGTEARIA